VPQADGLALDRHVDGVRGPGVQDPDAGDSGRRGEHGSCDVPAGVVAIEDDQVRPCGGRARLEDRQRLGEVDEPRGGRLGVARAEPEAAGERLVRREPRRDGVGVRDRLRVGHRWPARNEPENEGEQQQSAHGGRNVSSPPVGVFDRIARALDDALLLTPELREGIEAARAALEEGETDRALTLAQGVLAQRPDQAQALTLSGLARTASGDHAGARRDLEAATRAAPDEPEIAKALGDVCVVAGDLDAATHAYRAAALLCVREGGAPFAEAATALARVWTKLGRPDRAARELRKAAVAQVDAEVLTLLGRALLDDAQPAAAQAALRRAAELDADPVTLSLLGKLLLRAGDADRAEAVLRLASAALPKSAAVRVDLARALAAAGESDDARAEARAAVTLDPQDADAWILLSELGDPSEDVLPKLRALAPVHPAVVLADARSALEAGDPDRAEALAATATDGMRAEEASQVLSLAYLARGDFEKAALHAANVQANAELERRIVAARMGADTRDVWTVVDRIRRWAGDGEKHRTLAREADRIALERDRPLRLAVMGEFNAGKSTFINAWIGEEVAPMGVTPTTATLNLLSYGPEKKVRLHLADDSAREGRYEDLRRLLIEAEKEGPDRIRFVEILFPAEELLRVQILDTPGLNAPVAGHEETALRAIDEADAVVFLFRAGQAGKDTEREALRKIAARRRKVLGVVNHADRVAADDLPGILQRVREECGTALEGVVAISARQALEAKRSGDAALLERSALAAARGVIEERFFGPARAIKRRNAATRAEEAIAAALREAQGEQTRIEAGASEIRRGLSSLSADRTRSVEALRRAAGTVSDGVSQAARAAAAETAGFLAPRRRFWESKGVAPEDLEFLSDLFEDRISAVLEAARARLEEDLDPALPNTPVGLESWRAELRGAARGVLLLARGLVRGGRLERALLDSVGADVEQGAMRLRQVPSGVQEEAALSFGQVVDRALAQKQRDLEAIERGLARQARSHSIETLRVLEAFAEALGTVE